VSSLLFGVPSLGRVLWPLGRTATGYLEGISIKRLIVVVALVCALGFWPCSRVSLGQNLTRPALSPPPVAVGDKAPDFTLPTSRGNLYRLYAHPTDGLVLGVFCGCDRCRFAMSAVGRLQRTGRLLRFVGVVDGPRQFTEQFQRSTHAKGTMLSDDNGAVFNAYRVPICPEFYLLSSTGRVIAETRAGDKDVARSLRRMAFDSSRASETHRFIVPASRNRG
jgi:peroxiredoxin